MPLYRYTAVAAAKRQAFAGAAHASSESQAPGDAKITKGTLAADSDQHLRAALRGMGLQPLSIRPVRSRSAARHRRSAPSDDGSRRLPTDAPATETATQSAGREIFVEGALAGFLRRRRSGALVEWYESLAALLASGAPLASSLDLLGPRSRSGGDRARSRRAPAAAKLPVGRSERALELVSLALAERVRSGDALADAMRGHPWWFGDVDCALVASCERSGHAERALADLADLHARGEDLRGRLAAALAYPALLLVFGLGVVIFLTTTTLPQLAGVLDDAGATLPPATAALLALGGALTTHWPLTVLSATSIAATMAYAARSARLARLRLAIPLLGKAALRGQTASAALLLARLLDAGIPLAEAFSLVAPSVPNAALRAELLGLREALVAGSSLSERASAGGLIEPVFCRVLEVAEESGELAGALRTIGARQRESAKRLIDRLAATLEPLVILLLACGIGFVVYASIAPMLRIAQTL